MHHRYNSMSTHRELYLFAPENDMALAFGGPYYTPTPAAQGIARDLSLLPLWYAGEPDACIWSSHKVEADMQAKLDALGITSQAVSKPPQGITNCHPWGWSAYIKDRLKRNGINPDILPDDKALEQMRILSGRATSRLIMQEIQQRLPQFLHTPLPQILSNDSEVEQYVTSQARSILKAPWSSSGRGVWHVNGVYDKMTANSARGIINKQGYIMGEVLHDKVCDLAMEFYSDGVNCCFAGYSLFTTDKRGAYQGNILASDSDIEERLSQYIAPATLHDVREALQSITTLLIAPHYIGYMGIDMIVYRDSQGAMQLYPCIELNMRMSMGMVARIIADRYLACHSQGTYHVAYADSTAHLQELDKQLGTCNRLTIENGKITQGYLALTPLLPDTHYMAYIIVHEK